MTAAEPQTIDEVEHSPLPWLVCTEPANDSWYAGVTIYYQGRSVGVRVADTHPLDCRAKANAALIVRAVNSHEALVKALRYYANPPKGDPVPDFYNELDFGARATEALIQAGETP